MAEFTHESTEDQEEESLQEEVLDFAPAALDDSLPEVEDPLQEINLGIEEDPRPTFISALKLVEHKLPIKEGSLPVKQARRRMSMDTELKLANIVPVLKRKTGAVRICVDYRNLNEASPKDEYPMPMADMLVDGAAHNQMVSFMDGNAGYNQIMVAEEDIHKIVFMCPGHIGKIQPFSYLLRLKQEHTFKWEEQHQQAFEEIKHYLLNPPVMSPPKRGRPLKLYVSASKVSIGSLLVQDNKEGKEQTLKHYMLPYTIYIIAKTMLRGIIGKWTLALTEFAFKYVPQKAVKRQAIADFLADHPGEEIENMDSLDIANADLLTRAHTCLNNPIYSVHLTPWKLLGQELFWRNHSESDIVILSS
ncbi:unnamed protein product [Prunus armeniaca]